MQLICITKGTSAEGGDQVKEGALNNCQELWSGKVMKFVASLLLDCAVK